MRTAKLVLITLFAVLLIEVLAAEIFMRTHKFGAKEKPSWLEATIAKHARNISVPGDIAGLKNPRPTTEDVMAEAREHWREHCSSCHGVDGRGDTTVGRNMYPPAPNMNEAETQQRTDGELFETISRGVRLTGMPAWEGEDSPDAIWDLVSLIRRLPQLTPEELKEMKEMPGVEGAEEKRGQQPEGQKTGGENESVKPRADKPGTKVNEHTHEHSHEHSHEH
jgi:mono/diheme cytochrome c family protein